MKSWLCCIGCIAIAVFAAASCGDSSSTTGSGGMGGTGGTGGSGGMGGTDGGTVCDPATNKNTTEVCVTINDCDKATYTGSMPPEYICDGNKSTTYPNGGNACRNDSDCAIINTGKVRDIVRVIALSCRDREPMPGVPDADRIAACKAEADCNTAEVKKETARQIMEPGLTDACGQCYTGIALCSIAFCLSECAANADAIECVKCQFAAGCRSVYERCSGLDRKQ